MRKTEMSFCTENGSLVFKHEGAAVIAGSERTIALGGGIRARVVKTKEGKHVVASYMFDRNRFDKSKATDWLEKNSRALEKSVLSVQENMPAGSFQDITVRLQNALCASALFPRDEYGNSLAYVSWVFSDYCVASYGGKYYKIPYADESGAIELGSPVEVDMTFVAREADREVRRRESHGQKFELQDEQEELVIHEATLDDEKREVVAVLIEAGANYHKRRYYPKSTIQKAAESFAGLKMYIDHPTAREDSEKPERSIKDWVSTIVESWYEDGKAMGRIKIHDDYLWTKIKDPIFRENIGISINASGKRYQKEIDSQMMEVIEEITSPRSVDWVTEAGARGRVAYLVESEGKLNEEKENTMLKTVKELREAHGDLVTIVENEVRESVKKEFQDKQTVAVQEATKPLNEKITTLETENKALKESEAKRVKEGQAAKTTKILSESKLPAEAQARISESMKDRAFKDDAELETVVKESISKELDYIAKLKGKKPQSTGGKGEVAVTESIAALEGRMGVEDKKEEEKK